MPNMYPHPDVLAAELDKAAHEIAAERNPAADTSTLYRTLVRLDRVDANTVWLFVPASNFDQPIPFSRDDVQIPRWLLDKEPDYRFRAMVPILAETLSQMSLWNCENDPRTVAEQLADLEETS